MVSSLDDRKIIELFFERSEQAIIELSNKYGSVCSKVAFNILNNTQDTEECVNNAYLGTWNTIPPQNPNPLLSYVCRIVRNLAIRSIIQIRRQRETVSMMQHQMNLKTVSLPLCRWKMSLMRSKPHESLISFSKLSIRKTELCLFAVIGIRTLSMILPSSFIQATTTYLFGFLAQEKS